jgi:hypothetical protein
LGYETQFVVSSNKIITVDKKIKGRGGERERERERERVRIGLTLVVALLCIHSRREQKQVQWGITEKSSLSVLK